MEQGLVGFRFEGLGVSNSQFGVSGFWGSGFEHNSEIQRVLDLGSVSIQGGLKVTAPVKGVLRFREFATTAQQEFASTLAARGLGFWVFCRCVPREGEAPSAWGFPFTLQV